MWHGRLRASVLWSLVVILSAVLLAILITRFDLYDFSGNSVVDVMVFASAVLAAHAGYLLFRRRRDDSSPEWRCWQCEQTFDPDEERCPSCLALNVRPRLVLMGTDVDRETAASLGSFGVFSLVTARETCKLCTVDEAEYLDDVRCNLEESFSVFEETSAKFLAPESAVTRILGPVRGELIRRMTECPTLLQARDSLASFEDAAYIPIPGLLKAVDIQEGIKAEMEPGH